MTVRMEEVEFGIEDILRLHQGWITKLYVEDRMTEDEIVRELYERRFPVTVLQVRQCLLEWGLVASSAPRAQEISPERLNDWDITHSRPSAPSPPPDWALPPLPAATQDPKVLELYTTRPLPSLPSPRSRTPSSSRKSKHQLYPRRVKLNLAPYPKHDNSMLDSEMDVVPAGLWENYEHVLAEEVHERLVVNLSGAYRSSGETTQGHGDVPRVFRTPLARRRPSQHPVREPQWTDDKDDSDIDEEDITPP